MQLLDDMGLGGRAQELVLLAAGVKSYRLFFDELQLFLLFGRMGGLWFFVVFDDVWLEGALLLSQDVGQLLLFLQLGQLHLFLLQELLSPVLDGLVGQSLLLLLVEDFLGLERSAVEIIILVILELPLILLILMVGLRLGYFFLGDKHAPISPLLPAVDRRVTPALHTADLDSLVDILFPQRRDGLPLHGWLPLPILHLLGHILLIIHGLAVTGPKLRFDLAVLTEGNLSIVVGVTHVLESVQGLEQLRGGD